MRISNPFKLRMQGGRSNKKGTQKQPGQQEPKRQFADQQLFQLEYLNNSLNYVLAYDNEINHSLRFDEPALDQIIKKDPGVLGFHFIERVKLMKTKGAQNLYSKDLQQYGEFINYELSKNVQIEITQIEEELNEEIQMNLTAKRLRKKYSSFPVNPSIQQIAKFKKRQKTEIMNSLISNYQMIDQREEPNLQNLKRSSKYRQMFNLQNPDDNQILSENKDYQSQNIGAESSTLNRGLTANGTKKRKTIHSQEYFPNQRLSSEATKKLTGSGLAVKKTLNPRASMKLMKIDKPVFLSKQQQEKNGNQNGLQKQGINHKKLDEASKTALVLKMENKIKQANRLKLQEQSKIKFEQKKLGEIKQNNQDERELQVQKKKQLQLGAEQEKKRTEQTVQKQMEINNQIKKKIETDKKQIKDNQLKIQSTKPVSAKHHPKEIENSLQIEKQKKEEVPKISPATQIYFQKLPSDKDKNKQKIIKKKVKKDSDDKPKQQNTLSKEAKKPPVPKKPKTISDNPETKKRIYHRNSNKNVKKQGVSVGIQVVLQDQITINPSAHNQRPKTQIKEPVLQFTIQIKQEQPSKIRPAQMQGNTNKYQIDRPSMLIPQVNKDENVPVNQIALSVVKQVEEEIVRQQIKQEKQQPQNEAQIVQEKQQQAKLQLYNIDDFLS